MRCPCSAKLGRQLGHQLAMQLGQLGIQLAGLMVLSAPDLKPGDRVRWWTSGGVYHDGIVAHSDPAVTWVRWEETGVEVTVMTSLLERLRPRPGDGSPDTT